MRKLLNDIDEFFFEERRCSTLGLFRLAFGMFLILLLLQSAPNWERFYGPYGVIPIKVALESSEGRWWGVQSSLFAISDSLTYHWFLYFVSVLAVTCFTIGIFTRFASIFLFLLFASIQHRTPYMVNGQDQVASVLLLFCCFAPLADSLSLKRWLQARREAPKDAADAEATRPIWAWRLMQISVALVYIFAGPHKILDSVHWLDGTAMYYVSLSDLWFRFPEVEFLHNLWLSRIATWFSVFVECAFPVFVWVPSLQLISAVGMAIFHMGIMLMLSNAVIHFNLIMVISMILFIEPQIIARMHAKLPASLQRLLIL